MGYGAAFLLKMTLPYRELFLYKLMPAPYLPLRGRWPEGPEGESLAIIDAAASRGTALSPTACGRSPLPEGAKGRGAEDAAPYKPSG